jgi:branched-chain amino acid transport system ATP-binding protein
MLSQAAALVAGHRAMSPVLQVEAVTKRFGGITALLDVSLDLAPGSIHAVIGPNGSGKTTLFNVISGAYRPTAGTVRLAGQEVQLLPPERRARLGLGRTFQNTRLFASMTVLENVLVMRYASGLHWRINAAERAKAVEILQFVGLGDVIDAPAASLPQGQRRLLEIARATALEPKVLLLDEPHGGLNHTETARLVDVIRQLHQRGMTIMLIEHEMDVVMQLADDITVLNFGSVLCRGDPRAVQGDPKVIEAYLGQSGASAASPSLVTDAAPLLQVSNLQVRFGDVTAVRGIDLAVRRGEIVALLGSNGAGKSTTLKAITRLVPAASGSITLAGKSLLPLPTQRLLRLGLALVPERRRLFGGLTVVENLKIGAHGSPAREVARGIEDMLELFPNLRRLAGSLAFSLSGGEQQMLAIARALMSKPVLLMLDEPSLGLAPQLVDLVFETLREVNRRGTAILLVEQNAKMALALAHRAYVLASGRMVLEGPASAVAEDDQVRSAYLGAALSPA